METKEQKLLRALGELMAMQQNYEQLGRWDMAAFCENTIINIRMQLNQLKKPLSNRKLSLSIAPNTLLPNLGVIHHHRKHSTGSKLREIISLESILNGERGEVLRERVVAMLN